MTESCAAWRLPAGRGRAGSTNTTRWRCCGSVLLCIRKIFSGVRGFIDFCPFFQHNHFLKSVSSQIFDFSNVTGASLRCPGLRVLYGLGLWIMLLPLICTFGIYNEASILLNIYAVCNFSEPNYLGQYYFDVFLERMSKMTSNAPTAARAARTINFTVVS